MRYVLFLTAVSLAFAQSTPDLNGVWKASKEKSKMSGMMAQADSYASIQQSGSKIEVKTITMGAHFEQRGDWKYDTSGAETTNEFRGTKLATKAAWQGGALVIDMTGTDDGREVKMHETWTPSADGNSLTMVQNNGRGEMTMVFDKSPESASVFTAPPRMAKDVYQNVKDLNVPAYQLGEVMENFSNALGVRCGFCHVQGNFASDEKHTKQFARTMLVMTNGINHDVFHDHFRVSCYTCHRGQTEPPVHPESANNAGH
jgi:hypothetical protein